MVRYGFDGVFFKFIEMYVRTFASNQFNTDTFDKVIAKNIFDPQCIYALLCYR